MNVDLVTFIAQLVNFAILVLLLRHFLWGRIIRTMDERSNRLNDRMEEAAKRKMESEREAESYRRSQEELEGQRAALLSQAERDAEARRREMTNAARRDVEEEKTRWVESLRREQETFYRTLRERIQTQVFDTARKALRDLADEDVNRRMVEVFIERLRSLPDDRKRDLAERARISGQAPAVASAMEIPGDQRARLVSAVRQILGMESGVGFELAPDVIGGVELRVNGGKVAWSLESYLEGLEETVQGAGVPGIPSS